ncbi:succinate dehydrogenase [Purpureocillium lavendulum]|uniref:Succinate dehydrogenase n=1 Tax=Purpureocillium lavendulum TaxID=1247861 RepID=A0AB34G6H0_9HYPO|nr:succinate dehydrogenase [Purpureocillium lavendulum]
MNARRALQAGAGFCHFIIFASAVIVMALVASFLDGSSFRGYRVVYLEVISVFTLFIYLFAMFFPLSRSYRGYMAPVDWLFTYAWIAAFVFASQVWSGGNCANEEPTSSSCAKKKTVEAFTFIAFWFLLLNMMLEGALFVLTDDDKHAAAKGPAAAKERPGTAETDASGAQPPTQSEAYTAARNGA